MKAYTNIEQSKKNVFPELKESEDDKIKKAIHIYLDWLDGRKDYAPKGDYTIRDMIAWLEKQGNTDETSAEWSEKDEQMILCIEQIMNCASLLNIVPEKIDNIKSWLKSLRTKKQWKPTEKHSESPRTDIEIPFGASDSELQEVSYYIPEGFYAEIKDDRVVIKKIEPKLNVGNWVILPLGIIAHIDSLNSTDYQVTTTDGKICDFKISKQDNYRLWSINDAKDGDVLVGKDGRSFIFAGEFDVQDDNPTAYCGINSNDKLITGKGSHWTFKDGIKPATKEQRELLFKKIHEAGYEWDSYKKELKKIEPKTLDPDKVVEWLERNASMFWDSPCNPSRIVELFKKDFEI